MSRIHLLFCIIFVVKVWKSVWTLPTSGFGFLEMVYVCSLASIFPCSPGQPLTCGSTPTSVSQVLPMPDLFGLCVCTCMYVCMCRKFLTLNTNRPRFKKKEQSSKRNEKAKNKEQPKYKPAGCITHELLIMKMSIKPYCLLYSVLTLHVFYSYLFIHWS